MSSCFFSLEIVVKKPKGERILKKPISFLENIKMLTVVVGISSLLLAGCVGSQGDWTNSICPSFPWPSENIVNKLEQQARADEEFALWLVKITIHGEKIDICLGLGVE